MPRQLRQRRQTPPVVDLEAESTDEDEVSDFYRAIRHMRPRYQEPIDWDDINTPSTSRSDANNNQQILIDEPVESTSPFQLTPNHLLDHNEIKDFECRICLDVVFDHFKSQTCAKCFTSLCPDTCLPEYIERQVKEIESRQSDEEVKCPTCQTPLYCVDRPQKGPRSIEAFGKLHCICYFNPNCNDILLVKDYYSHVSECEYNRENCLRCKTKNRNQQFHLDCCMEELSSLHAELALVKNLLQRGIITVEKQDKCLEQEKEKNKRLEEQLKEKDVLIKRLSSKPKKISSISNPIHCTKGHVGKFSKFTVKYLDQNIQINGIPLEVEGRVLRSEIERRIGNPVGAILRCDYTLVKNDKILKHHQFGFKPTVLTVLPVDMPVEEGSQINMEVTEIGQVV